MDKKLLSVISVIMAGILWGSMGIFVRRLNSAGLQLMGIVELRAVVTAVIMFVILAIFRRDLLKLRLKDIWCFIGTGIGSIVFFNYCYFKTMVSASLSVAAILLYTAPAIVMLMSFVLFKEKMTLRRIAAVVIAFIGCVCVSGLSPANNISISCIITGLGAGLGYALYSIFGRFALQRGYSSVTISAYTFLFAAIGTLPLINPSELFMKLGTGSDVIVFAIIFGVVTTIMPYALYTWGLQYLENGKASVLASVEPVVATLIGIFVFDEALTVSAAIGIILVLISIMLCNAKE